MSNVVSACVSGSGLHYLRPVTHQAPVECEVRTGSSVLNPSFH